MEKGNVYDKPIIFYDIAVHENLAWFCNWTYCALFCLDLQNFQVSLEAWLPADAKNEFRQYGAAAYYDNKVILAPVNAKNIVVYDLTSKKMDEIPLDFEDYPFGQCTNLFAAIHIYRDAVFLFPGTYPGIVKMDLKTYEIKYIRKWYREALSTQKTPVMFFRSCLKDDGVCILPGWRDDRVLEINLNTEKYEIYKLGYGRAGLSDVVCSENTYWFSCKEEASVIEYRKGRGTRVLNASPVGMETERGFRYLLDGGDSVYGIPFYGNMMVKVDKTSGKAGCLKRFYVMEPTLEMTNQGVPVQNILCCREDTSGRIVLFSLLDGKIIVMNRREGSFQEHDLIINKADKGRIMKHLAFMQGKDIRFEHDGEGLGDFLFLVHNYDAAGSIKGETETCGKSIYKFICGGWAYG